MDQNMLFCNEFILAVKIPCILKRGGMKKVNKKYFYLLTLLLGYLPMETEQ